MKRYYLALDLKDDPKLIEEYEAHHRAVWPEILESIRQSGILKMEIYRVHNRLFMVMETADEFSFEQKAELDQDNAKVQEWEELMWKYQQAIPGAKPGEKWLILHQIFDFSS
jgi:L-rhamnose mutarotase